MEKAGALWLKDGKAGKFFSGQIEIDGQKESILVFKNTRKQEGTKQPDYQIFWADDEGRSPKRDEGGGGYCDSEEVPF